MPRKWGKLGAKPAARRESEPPAVSAVELVSPPTNHARPRSGPHPPGGGMGAAGPRCSTQIIFPPVRGHPTPRTDRTCVAGRSRWFAGRVRLRAAGHSRRAVRSGARFATAMAFSSAAWPGSRRPTPPSTPMAQTAFRNRRRDIPGPGGRPATFARQRSGTTPCTAGFDRCVRTADVPPGSRP